MRKDVVKMRVVAVCLLLLLGATSAVAAGNPPPAQPTHLPPHPCLADIQHFCKAVKSGDGRKYYCLDKHLTELQPACHKMISALDTLYAEMAARHHETVAKLLADSYARHDSGLSVSVPVGKPNPAPPNTAPPNPQKTVK